MLTISIPPLGSFLADSKFQNVSFHATRHEVCALRVQVDTSNFVRVHFVAAAAYVTVPRDVRTFNRLTAMEAGTLAKVLLHVHGTSSSPLGTQWFSGQANGSINGRWFSRA